MDAVDTRITKFIKKVQKRITEQIVLRFAGYGIAGGLFVAVICSVIALFVPWYYAPLYAVGAVVIGGLSGLCVGIRKHPDMERAALMLDAHGFHERLITSYGLLGRQDIYSHLQKQDTVSRLNSFEIRKVFPIKFRWQMLLALLLLAGAFVGITMIQTPAKEQAADYQEIVRQIDDELEKIDDTIEQVQNMEELSDEEKQDLIGTLERAREELEGVSNAE